MGHPRWPQTALRRSLQRAEESLRKTLQHPVFERNPPGEIKLCEDSFCGGFYHLIPSVLTSVIFFIRFPHSRPTSTASWVHCIECTRRSSTRSRKSPTRKRTAGPTSPTSSPLTSRPTRTPFRWPTFRSPCLSFKSSLNIPIKSI